MDMNSIENTWVINPSDLFTKPNTSNTTNPNISQFNDINFESFLNNENDDLDQLINDNYQYDIEEEKEKRGIIMDVNSEKMTSDINWNDVNFDYDGLNIELGENFIQNSLDENVVTSNFSKQDTNAPEINPYSTEAILLQNQIELKKALQKQQEMNMKLEQQLKQTQLQQKKLQNRLKEQDDMGVKRLALGDITSSSRLNSTPARKLKEFNVSKSSNTSPTKKYHNSKLSFVSPSYNTTIYGSPKRRSYINRNSISHDTDYSKIINNNKEQKLKINFATTLTPRDQSNFITDSELSSPTRVDGKSSPLCSPINEDIGSVSPVIGLGLSVPDSNKLTSNSLIPLIPNSFNRSPISKRKKPPSTYQDTPVRKISTPSEVSLSRDSNGENIFNDIGRTPQLGPPIETFQDPINSTLPISGIQRNIKSEEPESMFTLTSSPSPILKSQGHFEGESPKFGAHSKEIDTFIPNSPLKITRKLTTLPRGSIDRYVKELPDKTFECLYPGCNKFFKRRYNTRSHIQTHLEDRPYVCDFEGCNKAFVRNHDLVRHKKTHCEKTFGCPCGKMFNREDALIVHRSRMICIGGKKFDNVVIKRSPRKRGRPRKNSTLPILENDENSSGIFLKMDPQLNYNVKKNENR